MKACKASKKMKARKARKKFRRSYFIIHLVNTIFEVYESLPVKFCTLMTFQGGLILVWNIWINSSLEYFADKLLLTSQVYSSVTILRLQKACSRVGFRNCNVTY